MPRPARRFIGSARRGVLGLAALLTAFAVTATPAAAQSYTWSGAAAVGMSQWSIPGNWAGAAAPAGAVDALTFPDLESGACTSMPVTATCTNSFDDLTGISTGALTIAGRGYGIVGNPITLGAGGLTLTQPAPAIAGSTSIAAPIALGADQTWNLSGPTGGTFGQTLVGLSGALTGAGRALHVNVSNGVFLSLDQIDAELGPVTISGTNTAAANPDSNGGVGLFSDATTAALNATDANPVTVSHASLQGSGAIGALTTDAAEIKLGEGGTPYRLATSSATFDVATTTAAFLHATGAVAGTDYSQLTSTGAVHLAGTLVVVPSSGVCPTLPLGQVYTLVSTTGSLDGTYAGVANGATMPISDCPDGSRVLQIGYHATATPRTVTATVVDPSAPDLTPPTIAFVTPTNGQHFAQNASVTATATCSDAGSGIASCIYPATLDTATTGTHDFTVTATDNAGNTNDQTIEYLVDAPDTTAPMIGITSPADGEQFVLGSTVVPDVECVDASGPPSCVYPNPLDTSTLGPHTFTVTSTDSSDNHATQTVDYVVVSVIDTTPPTITITTPAPGEYTLGQVVTPDYTCTDPGGSGVQPANCTGPATVDTSTLGDHTYTVAAVDDAGNHATRSVTYQVVAADTTPPTITVIAPAEGAHFELGASVAADFTCADDSGAPTCSGPEVVDTSTVGPHTFVVTSSDTAGNDATKTVDYVVDPDTTPPTITITTPADGQHFAQNASVQAVFSCSPGSGTAIATCDGPAIDTSTVGSHTFTATSSDAAGNSTSKTVTYVIDGAAGGGSGTAGGGTGTTMATATATFKLGQLPSSFTPSSTGVIRLLLHCTATVRCAGTIRITVPRRRAGVHAAATATTVIASGRYSVAANKSAKIAIKLNAIGRKRVRASRTALRATLRLTPSDRRVKAVTRAIKLKLKRARR